LTKLRIEIFLIYWYDILVFNVETLLGVSFYWDTLYMMMMMVMLICQCWISFFGVNAAPKLKGRKRRKKLICYKLHETSSVAAAEQSESRTTAASTILQVIHCGT